MKRLIAVVATLSLVPVAAFAEGTTPADPFVGFLGIVQDLITAATPVMLAIMLAMGGFAMLKNISSKMFPSMKKGV